MCSPTRCRNCDKTTWTGCGNHVDQVMRNVPKHDRCECSPQERETGGLFSRLLGR